MVYHQTALDRTFAALADPTRRAIVARLSRGEAAIGDLARPFAMSLPAVSKHIRVLERAGLASVRREGRRRRCRLVAAPLHGAADWVEQYRRFWEGQLDQLARYLDDETSTEKEGPWQPRPSGNRRTSSKSGTPTRNRRSGSSARGPRRTT
ncbi:MAG TPA: metalloregulator ArsR/SmtB family transcription factor [Gemmatimonadales bacterium]|nr:metalloregulator ArsR/SmtB family transcription factor [Gemmatimonadales bacterium]